MGIKMRSKQNISREEYRSLDNRVACILQQRAQPVAGFATGQTAVCCPAPSSHRISSIGKPC
ncbi:hypothetical protein DYE42_05950 [Aeromonas dhakensis]|nr:hypothetical protein DYE42_05950 [Aeromonas dhakensis]